jgi:hypothetical protein
VVRVEPDEHNPARRRQRRAPVGGDECVEGRVRTPEAEEELGTPMVVVRDAGCLSARVLKGRRSAHNCAGSLASHCRGVRANGRGQKQSCLPRRRQYDLRSCQSLASAVLMTRMVWSVGRRAASASRPFSIKWPSEIIHFRSGNSAGASVTMKRVPFHRYSRSKIVQPERAGQRT